jgi:hypothetical protein
VARSTFSATIAPAGAPTSRRAVADARAQAPTSGRTVKADLLDCELVEPLAFDETLPDGRVVESPSGRGFPAVRLHLRLQNSAERQVVVWACHGSVWIVPDYDFGTFCGPSDAARLATLAPGGSALIYPTIRTPAMFTETFVFEYPPDASWYTYVPDPVSFELTSSSCHPL